MSLKQITPCCYDGFCPYDAEYHHDCEYWCGTEEPEDNPEPPIPVIIELIKK